MRYRPLGSTGINVSEIGFGAWGIGGDTRGATSYGPTDDNESVRALEKAYDRGINLFDTSGAYGKSEQLIGSTFKTRRDKIIIATKVGVAEHLEPQDFSITNIVESLQKSLRNLQTDYVDIYQLHSPKIEEINLLEITDTLKELKKQGLIRVLGISIKSPDDGFVVLRYGSYHSIQVNLSMIDQRAIDNGLVQKADNAGVGVIARTPLCFGFLTGTIKDLNFSSEDHRSLWPMEQLKLWLKASELFSELSREYNYTSTQLALRFCIDTQGVSTAIPGMLTVGDVLSNTAALELESLSTEIIDRIRRVYDDNNQFFIKPN